VILTANSETKRQVMFTLKARTIFNQVHASGVAAAGYSTSKYIALCWLVYEHLVEGRHSNAPLWLSWQLHAAETAYYTKYTAQIDFIRRK